MGSVILFVTTGWPPPWSVRFVSYRAVLTGLKLLMTKDELTLSKNAQVYGGVVQRGLLRNLELVIQCAMNIKWADIIQANRTLILDQWLDRALALFPAIMRHNTPIASLFSEAMDRILRGLEEQDNDLLDALDDVTRILAVQDFSPSRGMSMFIELKVILREIMKKSILSDSLMKEVQEACSLRVDALVLDAFDSYMRHRETIYKLKVEESSRRMFMALRRVEA
jgi:hypothetical protein